MQAPKSLRRPSNWQDFESLCKKLWGEIWNCPEIKKNGRNGQSQNGVDIYGIPKGEVEYYGIQCKGKDEYNDKQFTEEEIVDEIEKAKSFRPILKKLYFTTTALKDVKIEAFARKKNIENLQNNLFEVHLFSWEDIVDLIDENRITHDWYLNSQKFKLSKEVKVTFSNDSNLMECTSIFLKPLNKSVYGMRARDSNNSDSIFDYSLDARKYSSGLNLETYVNLSFFSVMIKLHNVGTDVIEDFKILLDFEGNIQEISETNESGIPLSSIHSNIQLDSIKKQVKIIPQKPVLVSDDTFCSDEIFIKPGYNTNKVIVKWRLLSKDFKNEGTLVVNININIETVEKEVNVPNSYKIPYTHGEIEDFIVPKSYLE